MTNPKDITPVEASDILRDIHFQTPLLHHQAVSLIWGAGRDRLMWWHDIGTGKTLAALYLNQLWDSKRVLVVCPNSVVEGWADQIEQHTDWPYVLVRGTKAERKRLLKQSGPRVWVINYGGLRVVFNTQTSVQTAGFDSVVFDEVHYLSNPKAQRTKWAKSLSKYAKKVIGMTGTPYTTSEESLWSQYDVLDGGTTLGSLRNFRKEHFHGIKIPRPGGHAVTIYKVRKGETERILDRVAPVTLRYGREECFDLPAKRYQIRRADMSDEQKELTKKLIEGCSVDISGSRLTVSDPMMVGNKLAQIAGGFVLPKNGNTIRLKKNPKLDALAELIDEIAGKVVIFHSYVEEGRMIEAMLSRKKIGSVSLRGETEDKTVWRRFNEDPRVRALVAHPKSGGEGLNLHKDCSTVVFYSHGCHGAQVRDQAEGRIWRLGQERPCLFIDLMLRGSIDESRLDRIRERSDILQAIVEYIEQA